MVSMKNNLPSHKQIHRYLSLNALFTQQSLRMDWASSKVAMTPKSLLACLIPHLVPFSSWPSLVQLHSLVSLQFFSLKTQFLFLRMLFPWSGEVVQPIFTGLSLCHFSRPGLRSTFFQTFSNHRRKPWVPLPSFSQDTCVFLPYAWHSL